MTVRELFREFAADRMRARDEFDRDTTLAYQVVKIYFQSTGDGKMPALDSLLSDKVTAPAVQTYDEQLGALKMLSEMFGGKLITLRRPA